MRGLKKGYKSILLKKKITRKAKITEKMKKKKVKKKEKKVLVIIACPKPYTNDSSHDAIRSQATTEVYLTGYEENGERHESLKEWLGNNTEHMVEELVLKEISDDECNSNKECAEYNIDEICNKIDNHPDCEIVYLSAVGHGEVSKDYPGGRLQNFGGPKTDLLYLNRKEKNLKEDIVKKYPNKKFHFNFCACHLGRAVPELIEPKNAIAGHGYDNDFHWCADSFIGKKEDIIKIARQVTEAHLTVDRTLFKKGEKGWATHQEVHQECKKAFYKMLYPWKDLWKGAFWQWLFNQWKVYKNYKSKKVYPPNTDATIQEDP